MAESGAGPVILTMFSINVCLAVTPTPFVAVMVTWCVPASAAEGVPCIVSIPVAKPAGFRFVYCRSGGSPVTVKYIPFPSVGLLGGSELEDIGCVERLGYPVVVTVK